MWNCRSKLKLGGNVVFTRAEGDVRWFCFRIVPPIRVGCVTPRAPILKGQAAGKGLPALAIGHGSAEIILACLEFLSQGPDAPEPFLLYRPRTSSRRNRSRWLLPP
jgi:hypothetical protein